MSAGQNGPKRGRYVLLAAVLLAVAGFYALGLHRYLSWDYVRSHVDELEAWVRENLLLAVLAFFVLYVTVTALSLPVAAVLSLLGGALFGRWIGTGVIIIAATVGATLAFLGSRYLLRDVIQRRWGEKLRGVNEGVERDGAYYLFTLRLVPAVPFWLINLGMGLTSIRVGTYAWVSLVGMLPGTFVYVNAGTELRSLQSPTDVLSPRVLISLALLGIVPLVLRKLLQWSKARR